MEKALVLTNRQFSRFQSFQYQAHDLCTTFRGKRAEVEELLGELISFEQWMLETFRGAGTDGAWLTECRVIRAAGREAHAMAIDEFLDLANHRIKRLLQKKEIDILTDRLDFVLLPSGSRAIQTGDGSGILEHPRFEPRLDLLIAALVRRGIGTDTMILRTGTLLPNQMRQESYTLLELPDIQREVLVCNQVGEATFVIRRHLGAPAYSRHTKEELQTLPGVVRIVCHEETQWLDEVCTALLADAELRYVNVRDLEAVRREIVQHVTPAQWVTFKQRQKLSFKIAGKGLVALATLFGVPGNPCSYHTDHLFLGAQIFGVDDPVIAKALAEKEALKHEQSALGSDLKHWRSQIKAHCTAEQWVEMTQAQKLNFKISGKGLVAIAALFNVPGHPLNNRADHIRLGVAVFGAEDPSIAKALAEHEKLQEEQVTLGKDLDKWRAAVRKQCPTVQQWVVMTRRQKANFTVAGKGLYALGTLFCVSGSPIDQHLNQLHLGVAIFGGDDPVIVEAMREEAEHRQKRSIAEAEAQELGKDLDRWRKKVLEQTTPHQWVMMEREQKQAFTVAGKGLKALARLFNVSGNSRDDFLACLRLGAAIFGEDDPEIVQAMRELDEKG